MSRILLTFRKVAHNWALILKFWRHGQWTHAYILNVIDEMLWLLEVPCGGDIAYRYYRSDPLCEWEISRFQRESFKASRISYGFAAWFIGCIKASFKEATTYSNQGARYSAIKTHTKAGSTHSFDLADLHFINR